MPHLTYAFNIPVILIYASNIPVILTYASDVSVILTYASDAFNNTELTASGKIPTFN